MTKEHELPSPGQPAEHQTGATQPDDGRQTPEPQGQATWRENLRWFGLRAAALLGAFLLLIGLLTAGAGWYTSRPEFCRSCHNMEPYYDSWAKSSHKDVSCIKCHFPPGAGEKIRGKMLGLVQLAKYVTQSGGPRPAAEIPDASCLRSGCHDTRVLSGRVDFQGVPFDHRPHLENVRRGKQLRCTSCHSQMVQGTHMTVTPSSCFLCHFKDGHFNEGLGTCTRCHQIPEQAFDLGGGVTFHHDLAYERGVDCANCHGDLIRGNAEVPAERCTVCHNREGDLKRISEHEFLHIKHVTEHKVDCLECHLEIHHVLDDERIQHAASDCTACHPNHHGEQVHMLQGMGGKSMSAAMSGMSSVRITCPTCHQERKTSPTGTVLWKASVSTCTKCHEESDAERYRAYHEALRAALTGIEAGVASAREALKTAKLDTEKTTSLTTRLNELQDDVSFLRAGNGIHNIHYASTLTRVVLERLVTVCQELKIKEPQVTLPTPERNKRPQQP